MLNYAAKLDERTRESEQAGGSSSSGGGSSGDRYLHRCLKDKWYTAPLGLLRRNFDGTPWMANMLYDAPQSLPWLSPGVFEASYAMFTYKIRYDVDGKTGVTLATMKATTAAIRAAFVAAHPGMDKPGL